MSSAGDKVPFAVVVPVFNAVKTVLRLVESLKRQTATQFEAFMVDDGSTDGTDALLADVAAEDRRFHVISANHLGPGEARNRALEEVERHVPFGIMFADADDWMPPFAAARACDILRATEADVVEGSPLVVAEADAGTCVPEPSPEPANVRVISGAERRTFTRFEVWGKFYRADFIRGLRFLSTTMSEDVTFNLEVAARKPKIAAATDALYVHVLQASSIWHSRLPASVRDSVTRVIGHLEAFYRAHPDVPGQRAEWERHFLPVLLKHWWRAVRAIAPEARAAARAEYVQCIRRLAAEGRLHRNDTAFKDIKYHLRNLIMLATEK